MAYNTLVLRNRAASLGGILDSLKEFGVNVVKSYGDARQAAGAAQAQQQVPAYATPIPADSGPSMTTIAIGGVAVLGAIYFIKKRSKKK